MPFSRRSAGLALFLISVLTLLSCFLAARLRFDYEFESFFPDNDPALPFFKEYRKTFGHDNEFVLIGLVNKKGIFNKAFLEKTALLSKKLERLSHIQQLLSPTGLKRVSLGGLSPVQFPLLHIENDSLLKSDSVFIYSSEQWKNNFFSEDGKAVCIYLQARQGLSKTKSDELAGEIKRITSAMGFDEVHYAGRIFAQKVFLEKLQKQFSLFILISLLFVTLLLWFTFKNTRAVLLPLSLIVISVLITFGIMSLLGKPIDIMAAMIPTMIFVAGMSDVIHFYTKYTDEMRDGAEQERTFRLIFREVAGPTFLTLISTVAGFLSLCYSGVKPIREFGIYTSVGIVIAFILTYTYLPAILLLLPPRKAPHIKQGKKIDKGSHKLFFWVIRNGVKITAVSILIISISCLGLSKIKADQKLLDDLSDKEEVKKDFLFFGERFGGVRPLEIDITVLNKDQTVWDSAIMKQLNKADSFLTKLYQPGFLLSAAGTLKAVNAAYGDGYVIPAGPEEYRRDVTVINANSKRKEYGSLVTDNGRRSRISAKIKDYGSAELESLNNIFHDFIRQNTDTTLLKFTITGTANLIDLNNTYIVKNTLQGLATGIAVLVLLTFILHRSLKMMVIFLIPNIVPLLIMAGIMGFAGIALKASTAIFFSIAFGIATDDTIHFISRFKLELKKNNSPVRAFKNTYAETGKAVFLTTVILTGGFISLLLSDFESIYLFGLLTCLTLIIALVAEVFLLPVLLMSLYRKKKK